MGSTDASELLPGTLDLLILKALARESMHGYGIAQHLRIVSDDVLQVGESSLYPALQRLLLKGWVDGGVGRVREQPPSPFLHAHAGRTAPGRRSSAANSTGWSWPSTASSTSPNDGSRVDARALPPAAATR